MDGVTSRCFLQGGDGVGGMIRRGEASTRREREREGRSGEMGRSPPQSSKGWREAAAHRRATHCR